MPHKVGIQFTLKYGFLCYPNRCNDIFVSSYMMTQAVTPKYFILRIIRWLLVSAIVITRIVLLLIISTIIFTVHTFNLCVPIPAVRRLFARCIDFIGYRLLLLILG